MMDMFSRGRYQDEIEESMDDEEELDFFKTKPATTERDSEEPKWLLIGRFLSTLTKMYPRQRKRQKRFGRRRINTSFEEDTFRSNPRRGRTHRL